MLVKKGMLIFWYWPFNYLFLIWINRIIYWFIFALNWIFYRMFEHQCILCFISMNCIKNKRLIFFCNFLHYRKLALLFFIFLLIIHFTHCFHQFFLFFIFTILTFLLNILILAFLIHILNMFMIIWINY